MTAMTVKKGLTLTKGPSLLNTQKTQGMTSGDYTDPMQRTMTNLRGSADLDVARTFASPSSAYTRWRDVLARKEANFNQHNVTVKANLAKSFQQQKQMNENLK
jgi:hypothetical protein